ncbi:phospholipase A1 [Campylobacter blaseri]|uniref:Phosphatidylcholine 1-acylhydrolase n=1 Tax=Campylobacter blaseri TaxID=2042961 RepID=A0A2P8R405_9BACT|nr:phospholipase A [Campylobacter blaseri]PSM53199.1 hypothetical protein CQ405_01230 [Campylobacter blaseri]PSM54665.1 hypothetical protein CRN67_01230 [Campylobacter blaseri]QKF86858.1 phospholipase A1 [Campylobacter blaseri]
MKKVIFLSFCAIFALANDDILKKAQYYESIGDYKNAMLYYKKLVEKPNIKEISIDINNTKELQKEEIVASAKKINKAQNEVKVQVIDLTKKYKTADESDGIIIHKFKPNYIAYAHDTTNKGDRKKDELKFQLSIQKPIIDNFFGLDETITFAYTQQSFWQIWEDSAPFRTTSYEPEIFVTIPVEFLNFDYLRFGLNHQSNGEDGKDSRSWNRFYVGTNFNIGNLEISPRVWATFGLDDTNKDIKDYLGYGDIEFKYNFTNSQILAVLRNNLNFSDNKGSLEFNYFFPIFSGKFQGFFQYFTGYGESLIDYNRHVNKFSLGISIFND